jgi:hypothetical protein
MSDYTYSNTWANKDGLATGVAGKRVSATEFHTEFGLIQSAIADKANTAAPAFTGTTNVASLTSSGTVTLSGTLAGTFTIAGGTFS